MGFRNPVLTAVDPVARASADAAGSDAARALTQIIPGSRIAADAIDGKTITGATISGASIIGSLIRATGSGDAYETSTAHGLQVGPTNGLNLAMDGNEIMARNNGAGSGLFVQYGINVDPAADYRGKSGSWLVPKRYVDGLTQRGNAGVATVTSGVTASVDVTFPVPFAITPTVVATPQTTVPGTDVKGFGISNVTATGFTIYLNRTSLTTTSVQWIASVS